MQSHIYLTARFLPLLPCGQGDAHDMHRAMKQLASLPPDTVVYCGHEYTLSNLKFALTIEPDNMYLKKKVGAVCCVGQGKDIVCNNGDVCERESLVQVIRLLIELPNAHRWNGRYSSAGKASLRCPPP